MLEPKVGDKGTFKRCPHEGNIGISACDFGKLCVITNIIGGGIYHVKMLEGHVAWGIHKHMFIPADPETGPW